MLKINILLAFVLIFFSTNSFANERENVLKVVDYFYKGDHEGSKEYRKLSMHPLGAYRYIDATGKYKEAKFEFYSGNADISYKEELLSLDIHEHVALVRLRLAFKEKEKAEYKLMTLHKSSKGWLITSISWGMGTTVL
jgi:hypothetical protein